MGARTKRWAILAVLGLFFFMVIVDGTIVTIAIPQISRQLAVATSATTLIVSIYLIVICATLMLFGQFGDKFGRTNVFKVGTLVFLLGSFLAGAGQKLEFVLFGRLIQGIGASMTMANSYAIVSDTFPSNELGRAFGVESAFISLGALAGPGLGGLILAHLPWGYIFWINLPVGILCLIVELIIFPKGQRHPEIKLDWRGALLLGMAALALYLLTTVANGNAWLFAGLLLLFAGFSWWFIRTEKRIANPLLDPQIFRVEGFRKSILTSFITFIVSFFFALLAPLYLQLVLDYPAQLTGLLLMVAPLVSLVVAPIAGYVSDHHDQRLEMTIGMGLLIVAQAGLLFLSGSAEPALFILISIVMATGTSVFGTPNSVLVMSSVPTRQRGMAGSTNSLVREFGLVLGTALTTVTFYRAVSIIEQKPVTTAIGLSNRTFLIAQRWAYGLGLFLLVMAMLYIIYEIRRTRKSD